MTSYLQYKLLDALLGIATYTMPAAVYLSLHNADPTDTGSHANEVSATGSAYARVSLATKMSSTDTSSGISLNTATISFGPATTDWGEINHVGVEDNGSAGAGNMLMSGAPSEAKIIPIGEPFQLVAGQLSLQFD